MHKHNDTKTDRTSRVLVVDDEKIVRRVLTQFLAQQGHSAITACSGAEALERLDPGIDLVYLDYELPDQTGVEVAEAIRERTHLAMVPIIMITGHQDRATRIRALEAGVNDFLLKPFDSLELRLRTEQVLELKHSQDALRRQRTSLAAQVAERSAAVHHALREVERQRDELNQAHLETLERLALAAEYKDHDTATHILRVGAICALLAERYGCSSAQVELLRLASPLHDVGKIGVPDHILLKPGRLDADEREVMQRHADIGARILAGSRSPVLQAAEEIARSHHEWWDGNGYPNGLAGEEIPLFGRITAVADVFDALTTRRPYKEPFPLDKVLKIMREHRGQQFEPRVLDLLVESLDDVLAIRQTFTDTISGEPAA